MAPNGFCTAVGWPLASYDRRVTRPVSRTRKTLASLRRIIVDSYEPDAADAADEDGVDEEGAVETVGFSMLVFTLT